MKPMMFIFARSDSLGSRLIRAGTVTKTLTVESGWSHCGAIFYPPGPQVARVIDSMVGHGVRDRTFSSFSSGFPETQIISIQCDEADIAAADRWLVEQIGSGYDYKAWLAAVAPRWYTGRRNMHYEGRFDCAELMAKRLSFTGNEEPPYPNAAMTPNRLFEHLQAIQRRQS